ncbi:MAG: uracil-DNA glycosylase family protein [Phycisphaerales bacterium]|jgi:uracil-DNA glycosylase
MRLTVLLEEVRSCTLCAEHLPLGPKPLVQAAAGARVLIIGQAPGSAAHASGKPWDDRSGQRLREWLGVDEKTFYDPKCIALVPMGFCFPGTGASGDLPPRPECAPAWHAKLRASLKRIELTILLGRYAFEHELGDRYGTLTEATCDYPNLLPSSMVLPHPSPRNNRWLAKNPWFLKDAAPTLQARMRELLGE